MSTPPLIPFSFIRSHPPTDLRVPERVRALEAEWCRKWTPQDVWDAFLMNWVVMRDCHSFTEGWYGRVMGWTFEKQVRDGFPNETQVITTPNSRKAGRSYTVTAWGCSCPATGWCRHRTCYSLLVGLVSFGEEEGDE